MNNLLPYPTDSEAHIYCQVCGKQFSRISPGHVKMHNMNMEQYRFKYPDADLTSKLSKLKLSTSLLKKNKAVVEEPEQIQETFEFIKEDPEVDIEEMIIGEEVEVIDKEPIIEEESFSITKEKSKDKIVNTKEDILDLLLTHFSNVQVDYLIQNFDHTNRLIYEHITDFCDPTMKIVIDFPHSFFHNNDKYLNLARDSILERDGWKIIKIGNISKIDETIEKSYSN